MSIVRWGRRAVVCWALGAGLLGCGNGSDSGVDAEVTDSPVLPVFDGSITINVTVQPCPALTSITASPLSAAVGGSIAVTVTTTTPEAGTITFWWSAPSGKFANAAAPETTFTCTAPGAVMMTVVGTYGYCVASLSVPVTCRGP